MTIEDDILLAGHASGLGQGFPFGNKDLRLDNVDACDFFGDGVFDLDARVHFDEIEFTTVHIHQEFHSARTFIIHMGTDFPPKFADFCALGVAEIGGRGPLDHFLIAPLDRTIAFPQVIDFAMFVA